MSDPRASDWTPRRRALAWTNLALQSALLLALLVVVNLIARRSPSRIDLTSRRSYRLSNPAEDALKNLSYDVEIWLNSDRYAMSGDKSLSVAMLRTRDLLEEFRKRTPRLTVTYIGSGEREAMPRFRQHWSSMSPATIYILATVGTGRVNKKAVEVQQLYEGNAVTGEVTAYRGESVLITALRELGGGVKRIAYESEGHEEYVTADKARLGALRHHLTVDEGIEVKRLPLIEFNAVPDDCELLMILGPAQPFKDHEINVLRDYLERGGSLLVAVRPRVKTGLEKLLEEYSVAVGDNWVHDHKSFTPPLMTNLVVKDFNVHDINRSMVNLQFDMPEACTIDAVPRKDPAWRITPLAMAGATSWAETGEIGPDRRPRPDGDERQGDLKLIVVVEKPASRKIDDRHKTAKLDVWGSVMPFTNAVLYPAGRRNDLQLQYVINHFRWLMDRELMTIKPESISVRPLDLTADQVGKLKGIVLIGFPAFGVALGLLAWFFRRK